RRTQLTACDSRAGSSQRKTQSRNHSCNSQSPQISRSQSAAICCLPTLVCECGVRAIGIGISGGCLKLPSPLGTFGASQIISNFNGRGNWPSCKAVYFENLKLKGEQKNEHGTRTP